MVGGSAYAFVPARAGSKGIPGKNLRTVDGVPLVVRAVTTARGAASVDRVVVSTDDDTIAALARDAGAEVITRPPDLAADDTASESVLVHALDALRARGADDPDVTVLVQCTSPFTESADIDGTIALLYNRGADCAFTASRTHSFLWREEPTGIVAVNHDPSVRPRRQDRPTEFAGRRVGPGEPAFIVAEIGINHNGSVELAKQLVAVAVEAGCAAVKFQKRTPELCVQPEQRDVPRDTPWGVITYLEYRQRVELGDDDYAEIDRYCSARGIPWFASCWDPPSVDFMERFTPPCHKVASPSLTDGQVLERVAATERPVILSTGMSTMDQIRDAVAVLPPERLVLAHSTSTYPCRPDELNLRMIATLREEFSCLVGYSGHEVGLQTTVAAVALGACLVERHVTLDRAMWGSDQAASVEPAGMVRLVRDIRVVEAALGDGVKRVHDSELASQARLRRA